MANVIKKLMNMVRRVVFKRFLISYLVIIVLIIAISSVTHNYTIGIMRDNQIKSAQSELSYSMDILESRFIEVESMSMQLAGNRNTIAFANNNGHPLKPSHFFKLYELIQNFPNHHLTNSFISDVVISMDKPEVMLSLTRATARYDDYYKNFLNYSDYDIDQWRSEIKNGMGRNTYWPVKNISINQESGSYITYIHPIKVPSTDVVIGNVITLIREEIVKDYLSLVNYGEDGWIYISDSSGRIIVSSNIEMNELEMINTRQGLERITNKDTLTFIQKESDRTGWTYSAAIPSSILMQQVNSAMNVYYTVIVFVLIVGLLYALIMSQKNYKPIMEISRIFNQRSEMVDLEESNDLRLINKACHAVLDQCERLVIAVDENKLMARIGMIETIFRGTFSMNSKTARALDHLGVNASCNSYLVLMLKITNTERNLSYAKIDLKRTLCIEEIKKIFGKEAIPHALPNSKIALLLCLESTDDDTFESQMNRVQALVNDVSRELVEHFEINVVWGMGLPCSKITEVSVSYNQALQALDCLNYISEHNSRWFSPQDETSAYYSFPLEIENKLIENVRVGAKSELEGLLVKIFKDNSNEERMTQKQMQLLANHLCGTIIRIIRNYPGYNQDEMEKIYRMIDIIDNADSLENKFEIITDIFHSLCDLKLTQRKNQNLETKNSILRYINENFNDPELDLSKIAAHFNISAKYFSDYFKELNGYTFASYLENIRLEHASLLIETTSDPVGTIANNCGYLVYNTFYRAFKRKYGMNPVRYMNVIQGSLINPSHET